MLFDIVKGRLTAHYTGLARGKSGKEIILQGCFIKDVPPGTSLEAGNDIQTGQVFLVLAEPFPEQTLDPVSSHRGGYDLFRYDQAQTRNT